MAASAEDCPCCNSRPGDNAIVVAFLEGWTAFKCHVPLSEALCSKHGAIAKAALLATFRHGSDGYTLASAGRRENLKPMLRELLDKLETER